MAQQDECAELTWDQLDLVILGQIMANITLDDVGKSGHTPVSRTRSYVAFYYITATGFVETRSCSCTE